MLRLAPGRGSIGLQAAVSVWWTAPVKIRGASDRKIASPFLIDILKGCIMGKFHDVIENAAELPEEVKEALTAAYEEDYSIVDAKVDDLSSKLAAKDGEITEKHNEIKSLKSANYDLLRAVPSNAVVGRDDNDDDSNNQEITIADLFGPKK